jgi:Flp pilus assembly protein TadB
VKTRRSQQTRVVSRSADRQSKKVANRTTARQRKATGHTADLQSKYAAESDEWEISPAKPEIQYIDSIECREKAETRAFIVKVLITFLLASVVAAGVYGLWTDRITVVAATWATVFAALTPIINFYLERKPKQR